MKGLRPLGFLAIMMLVTHVLAQQIVTMDVSRAGKHIGTAKFSAQITSTGAFLQHETLTMSSQGRSMTIDETARDGRSGLPLTRVLHISGGGQNAEISVTFSSSGAKVQAKAA